MMCNKKLAALFGVLCLAVLSTACAGKGHARATSPASSLPPVILWAWERPEDLTFLDADRYGVAFLAQTLVLQNDEVVFRPRRQPLKVSPATKLIAVTRIESIKIRGERAALSAAQADRLVSLVYKTLELDNVSAIQIDFDATKSEREFYRRLLVKLRQSLPNHVALSMTALASFCVGDRWLDGLPVDEAVPMIFRMGLDNRKIKSFLAAGNDFKEPLCQKSYGIAVDEPLEMTFESGRRLYIFNHNAWAATDLPELKRGVEQ
jgi:hypothetical protein